MIHEITIRSAQREEMIDVTSLVQQVLAKAAVTCGTVTCFVPHTTAGITINENADPDVQSDILSKLRREIPQSDNYAHAEGNSDAHLKASLMGCSLHLLVDNKTLVLGTWQAIFFCEFDGPRTRKLLVSVAPYA